MAIPNQGEYVPPHLRDAMKVTRLANAEHAALSNSGMRYVIVCNIHEGIDPELPLQILDSQDGTYLFVSELLSRLSEDSRKRILFS